MCRQKQHACDDEGILAKASAEEKGATERPLVARQPAEKTADDPAQGQPDRRNGHFLPAAQFQGDDEHADQKLDRVTKNSPPANEEEKSGSKSETLTPHLRSRPDEST